MNLRSGVIICSLFVGQSAVSLTLNPAEFNECVYSYWQSRVNGGVIDAKAATSTSIAQVLPNITANYVAANDFLAVPPNSRRRTFSLLKSADREYLSVADIHAKKVSEKAAELDFEDQLLNLMKTSTNAFYSEISTAARVKLSQKRTARLLKAIALAKETSRLHLADSSSYYWAQADKEELDIAITTGQAAVDSNMNMLKASIGSGETPLVLDENYNLELRGDLSTWLKKVDDLPAVQVIKTKAEAAGAQATSAHDQYLPTLSLNGGYGINPNINAYGRSAEFSVSLTLPLFDQGLRSVQTQQAESQKSVFEAQLLSKRESTLAEVKNLYNQWQADEKVLSLAKDQLEHNRQGYDALMTLYSFGKTTFLSIRDSESSLVNAEIQLENVKSKIASEKMTLKLFQDYSLGHRLTSANQVKCPLK